MAFGPLAASPVGLCLVKTSSAAEIVAFPATAGYRRRHAHDHHDSRRHAARDLPQPRVATPGKPRPPPAGGSSEGGKATAVASDARPLVLGHPFPPLPLASLIDAGCGLRPLTVSLPISTFRANVVYRLALAVDQDRKIIFTNSAVVKTL